jgi:uncharacterized small protein (DUF1192 family)
MISINLKNYEISSNNNEIWKVDNFDLPAALPKPKIDVLIDLILLKFSLGTKASFQIEINNNSQLKILEINTANIARELKIGTEYFPISEIFSQLSKFLGIEITTSNWTRLLIDLNSVPIISLEEFQGRIKSVDETFSLDQNDPKNNGNPQSNDAESETQGRFNEINSRIAVLEKELELNVNGGKKEKELNTQIASLESEISTLNASISSVTEFIKKRDGVVSELKKLEPLSSDSDLAQKVERIKKRRLEKIFTYLANLGSRLGNKFSNGEIGNKSMSGESIVKILLILVVIQLLLSITLYLYSLNNQIIFISFIGLSIQVVLIILANIVKSPKAISIADFPTKPLEKGGEFGSETENKFLINSAFVDALKKELRSIEKNIKSNLKDRDLAQVKGEIEQKQQQLETVKKELGELGSASLSQEEYLKKRRNLDILKIERENIQAELPSMQPNDLNVDESHKKDIILLPLIITGLNNLESKLKDAIQATLATLRNERQIIVLDVE